MVSADNLNLDVLEEIFAYVQDEDLFSLSLVSQSFLASAIPHLYRNLTFSKQHAKLFNTMISSFAVVLKYPSRAVHVKRIEIRAIPTNISAKSEPDSRFISECTDAIALCQNIREFIFTGADQFLVYFLPSFETLGALTSLHIRAAEVTEVQVKKLIQYVDMNHLSLENPSWQVIDALPKWTHSLSNTLEEFLIFQSHDMNDSILYSVLSNLLRLNTLHVLSCPSLSHAKLFSIMADTSITELKTLSFTLWSPTDTILTPYPSLNRLRHLAIDMRPSFSGGYYTDCKSLAEALRVSAPQLTSLAIYLAACLVPDTFLRRLLKAHSSTLREITLVHCIVSAEQVQLICSMCKQLRRLGMPLPTKNIQPFVDALSQSKSIVTLEDTNHAEKSSKRSLTNNEVVKIMNSAPSLHEIISGSRVWRTTTVVQAGRGKNSNTLKQLALHRRSAARANAPWYMPRKSATTDIDTPAILQLKV